VKEGVVVRAGQTKGLTWKEESAGKLLHFAYRTAANIPGSVGTEIWRIGTPDKSAGEFNGFELNQNKTYHPPEYRSYWGAYSFMNDFPNGVNFIVGQSDVGTDWVCLYLSVKPR
jgi:rhamnogalacturonan endolyase